MKISFIVVGKTSEKYLKHGIAEYEKRLVKYTKFSSIVVPAIKSGNKMGRDEVKNREAAQILKKIDPADFVILLDERGEVFTSAAFAHFLQNLMNRSYRKLVFICGGAYGFGEQVNKRANAKIALSAMTFSHQMVRLFFTEQLYRAFTILNNEPYHH